jgi:hypothetical protein
MLMALFYVRKLVESHHKKNLGYIININFNVFKKTRQSL